MALKKSSIDLLFFIANKGGARRFAGETTSSLAREFGAPQQTVSRWAIELEKQGLLERGEGGYRLTAAGVEKLREIHAMLSAAFGEKRASRVAGVVSSGFGDGKYYLSHENYAKQLAKGIGFVPFPGTLNIRIGSADDVAERTRVEKSGGARIRGFLEGGRAFGGAMCFPAVLFAGKKSAPGAVILPDRSHYGPETVEFISKTNLRKSLSLRDGDRVSVEFLPKNK